MQLQGTGAWAGAHAHLVLVAAAHEKLLWLLLLLLGCIRALLLLLFLRAAGVGALLLVLGGRLAPALVDVLQVCHLAAWQQRDMVGGGGWVRPGVRCRPASIRHAASHSGLRPPAAPAPCRSLQP